jgi:nucleoside-diphosphate-sugar epimerase
MPTALVTGATGAVGPALVERLLGEGLRVRLVSRGALPVPWPREKVEAVRGDVTDRATVGRAVEGMDWVFHLAAQLHVARPDSSLAPTFERVNVEGTRVLVEEAARAGVKRLVFFSTISVYGPTGPEGADEDSVPRPDTLYGETKLRAEDVVRSAPGSGDLTTAVLRLAAVYGPRMKGNYVRLARALGSGWFVPIGRGLNRRTLVHEVDVAEAALLAASSPRAAGRLYNVTDGNIHHLRDILAAVNGARGRRRPRLHLPIALARAAAWLGDGACALAGQGRPFAAALDTYTQDVAVRGDRIRNELAFRPRFDLESGWRDALGSARRIPY